MHILFGYSFANNQQGADTSLFGIIRQRVRIILYPELARLVVNKSCSVLYILNFMSTQQQIQIHISIN